MNLRNKNIEKNGQIYNLKVLYSCIQGKENIKQYIKANKIKFFFDLSI